MISKMDRILLSGLARIVSWGQSEKGQGAFEYVLILGGLCAVIVAGLVVFGGKATGTILCISANAIKAIPGFTTLTLPTGC